MSTPPSSAGGLSPLRTNRTYLDGTLSTGKSVLGYEQQSQQANSSVSPPPSLKGYGLPSPATNIYADGLVTSPSRLTPRSRIDAKVTQGSTDATGAVSQALKHIRQLRMQRSHQQVVAAAGSPPSSHTTNASTAHAAAPTTIEEPPSTTHRQNMSSRFGQRGKVIPIPNVLSNKYLVQTDGSNLPDGDHTTFLTDTDDDVDEQRAVAPVQANQGVGKSVSAQHKEEDENRLPGSVLSETGLTEEITNAAPDRVVPQFIKALTSFSAARQRLHVKLFDEHLPTFLLADDTTPLEWEMLLTLLFVLARRRGGLSVLQRRYHVEISNLCLGLLCRLLATPEDNPRFPEVLTALNSIMYKVGCTKEDDLIDAFFTRPDAIAGLTEDALKLQDVSGTLPEWCTDDDVDSSDEDLPEVENRYQRLVKLNQTLEESTVAQQQQPNTTTEAVSGSTS